MFIRIYSSIILQKKWKEREQRLIEEYKKLDQDLANAPTQKFKVLQTKLNAANDMINKLNNNLKSATDEWNKREVKLKEECNHLKYQLQNTPKAIAPDVERIQEQLKDSQEMNLKLKLDFDSCKDKCSALETLCSDLKKIIMDEQIADKLYANDNIPATVKQFLSSSSSSVINTLSHVFGCLSKSSSRNRYSSQKEGSIKRDLFTTNESLMINDLSRSYEHNEIIKELIKEKEQLKKENLDLKRQVKELEQIVRRRAHPNFSNVADIFKSNDTKQKEQENETFKNLKMELLEKQHIIIDLKNQLVESKAKHDQNLLNLQGKVVNIQEESFKLKEELDKKRAVMTHAPKCKRRGRTCDPPLPSTRNFRMELSVKEKEIQALNKHLDELKRVNRKLIEEKSYRISYLSSKEQSADDIPLLKKLPSEINSEINTPDKTVPSSIKNFSIELNNDDDKQMNNQNLKNMEDTCIKSKTIADVDGSKTDEINFENKLNSDTEDYKVLARKLNYLEEKHQNLQQITCDLISLFNKETIGKMNKEEPSRQPEEFAKLVTALKDFSK